MKTIGLIGAFLVFSAVFLPIVRAPLTGSMSFAGISGIHAAVMIGLSLLAVVFILKKSFARLGATGFCAALVLAVVYFRARSGDLYLGSAKGAGFLEGVRRGVHAAAWKNLHYEWGLWVFAVGILFIFIAALSGTGKRTGI